MISNLEVVEVSAFGQLGQLKGLKLFVIQIQLVVELDGAVPSHALRDAKGLTSQLEKKREVTILTLGVFSLIFFHRCPIVQIRVQRHFKAVQSKRLQKREAEIGFDSRPFLTGCKEFKKDIFRREIGVLNFASASRI